MRGVALGETILHGRVKRPAQDTLTPTPADLASDGLHDAVLVVVRFDAFVLHTPTSQLLQGHETFVHVEGGGGEVPGEASFESVEVEWHSSDSHAVQLLPPLINTQAHNPLTHKLLVSGCGAVCCVLCACV